MAVVLVVVVGAAVAEQSGLNKRGGITALRVTASGVSAVGPGGESAWSFRFPYNAAPTARRNAALIDLDGDGPPDAVTAANLQGPSPDAQTAATLFAVRSNGTPMWQASIPDEEVFTAGRFTPPWQSDDIETYSSHHQPRIAWALHHYTWWPSLLVVFDGRGIRLGTFVNSGWIRSSHITPDGRFLITAGFSNSHQAAAFAVLDPNHPSGTSPEDDGTPFVCRNCPEGHPLRYFVVDWTDVASTAPDERDATAIPSSTGTINLRAILRRNTEIIVELSPSLDVVRASLSDSFWAEHARLERDGTIHHDRGHCPFRNGPRVREWTPEAGWRNVS